MVLDSTMNLPMEECKPDADICMSDRLVPSRGTCGSVGQLKLERDENWAPQNDYQDVLSQNVLGKESLSNVKILSYKHKPQQRDMSQNELKVLYSCNKDGAPKLRPKCNRVLPQNAMKVLDAPGLEDNFYGHPIDWSRRNVIAVALSEMVFLFDAASGRTDKLLTLPSGNVTSLRWTDEGAHLSVGTTAGDVQIWDASQGKQLRNLRGHSGRLGSLAWNEHMLSTGAADAEIHNHDVRAKDHLVSSLAGAHSDLVCGLDYNADGWLASGSNDNTVCIWDSAMARTPLHTLTEHAAAVKALRWCPWQRHVLASGGGSADRQVCLWNASSARLLMSVDTESQVTGLIWGQDEKELLASHGYSRNHLSLWKFPSLVKAGDLEGHEGRIVGMAQSPDGSIVCSAAADETLRFWRVFSPTSGDKPSKTDTARMNPIVKTIR
jgi:cell division cycle protein 20 (cofactor of APC complex)